MKFQHGEDAFEAWIESDGKRLNEYNEEVAGASEDAQASVTCYVECEEGKAFRVVIQKLPHHKSPLSHSVKLYINGDNDRGHAWQYTDSHRLSIVDRRVSNTEKAPMLFAAMGTCDLGVVQPIRDLDKLGVMELFVTPGTYAGETTRQSKQGRVYSTGPTNKVTEKLAKMASTVEIGDRYRSVRKRAPSFWPSVDGAVVVFKWRYYTRAKLSVLGILPDISQVPALGSTSTSKRGKERSIYLQNNSTSASRKRPRSEALEDDNVQLLEDVKPGGKAAFDAMQKRLRHQNAQMKRMQERIRTLEQMNGSQIGDETVSSVEIVDLTED